MRRWFGWLRDPIRRRQVFFRIVESAAGLFVAMAAWDAAIFADKRVLFPAVVVLGILVEFLLYEFVLEPSGKAGHYWERGPRAGETFTEW